MIHCMLEYTTLTMIQYLFEYTNIQNKMTRILLEKVTDCDGRTSLEHLNHFKSQQQRSVSQHTTWIGELVWWYQLAPVSSVRRRCSRYRSHGWWPIINPLISFDHFCHLWLPTCHCWWSGSFDWRLTARQHRKGQFVPTAGGWNRLRWLWMANETQCIILNTLHSSQ